MASRIQGITVEIGGDTTKLSDALKGVNSEISSTQSQLKDVDKLLKLDPTNTELLSQKQQLLGDAVGSTKEKLESLKLAAEQANTALENGDISQAQYEALQREIVATEQSLERLESAASESSVAVQQIAVAGENLQELGSDIEDVGKKMSVVSAAIVAGGVASANMAMDFEDAMAKVNTIADTTQVPLEELEDQILALSNETGVASTEIAENVYNAISAGQSTGDAVNFVSEATKLAKAGFADTGDSLDVLTTIMNAYGLEADKVTDVSDMLIQTQNLGKTTVAELSSTMGKLIPTANAYSVELDQLCAGYALMTSNGVATAESTTYMNAMLNELGESGSEVSDILKSQTGSSFTELMEQGYSLSDCLAMVDDAANAQGLAFTDMWSSSEAAKAGLILLGDSAEDFNSTLAQMNESTGATDTAFEKLQTDSYTIQVAINQLKNSAIELGSAIMSVLAPVIVMLSEQIYALTSWFSGLSDSTKETIVMVGLVIAAIGPMLIIIGKVISTVGTIMTILPQLSAAITAVKGAFAVMNAVMLANPILLVIAAIVALVAAFAYLWKNNEAFRDFWIELWEAIKEISINVWTSISSFFIATWEQLKESAESIWKSVSAFFESVWDGIKSIFTVVLSAIELVITTYFTIYKTIIFTILNVIVTIITTIWNTIKGVITTVVEGIQVVVEAVFQAMENGIDSSMGGIYETIVSGFNKAVSFVKGLSSSAVTWGKDMVMGIVNGITSCIGEVTSAVKSVASTITSYLHFSVPDEGPLTEYESWMPDFMEGLAKGIDQSKYMVANAVKGVASDMILSPSVSSEDAGALYGGSSSGSTWSISDLTTAISSAWSQMNQQSGDIVIPVYVGGTMLDEVIVTAQSRANLRSGGR